MRLLRGRGGGVRLPLSGRSSRCLRFKIPRRRGLRAKLGQLAAQLRKFGRGSLSSFGLSTPHARRSRAEGLDALLSEVDS